MTDLPDCTCDRGVVNDELDGVSAAPPITTQMTGNMDCRTTRVSEKTAERCFRRAKRDRRQPRPVKWIGQGATQMAVAHGLEMGHSYRREDEARLRIGRPKRGQLLDMINQLRFRRRQ